MSPMPKGWTRTALPKHVEWKLGESIMIQANKWHARIVPMDHDDRDLCFWSEDKFEEFVSVARRALRQHIHLKAHPEGPVLGEEEEERG